MTDRQLRIPVIAHPLRAVIYARFSTDMQRDASIGDQIPSCREHAVRLGLDVIGVCSDKAVSGAIRALAANGHFSPSLSNQVWPVSLPKRSHGARRQLDPFALDRSTGAAPEL